MPVAFVAGLRLRLIGRFAGQRIGTLNGFVGRHRDEIDGAADAGRHALGIETLDVVDAG